MLAQQLGNWPAPFRRLTPWLWLYRHFSTAAFYRPISMGSLCLLGAGVGGRQRNGRLSAGLELLAGFGIVCSLTVSHDSLLHEGQSLCGFLG